MPVTSLPIGLILIVVNAATATGLANSTQFTLQARPDGSDRTLSLQATGTYTVCTADLEQSLDGGVTFNVLKAGMDLFAAKLQQQLNIGPGPVLQVNIKTFTGTSVTVRAVAS